METKVIKKKKSPLIKREIDNPNRKEQTKPQPLTRYVSLRYKYHPTSFQGYALSADKATAIYLVCALKTFQPLQLEIRNTLSISRILEIAYQILLKMSSKIL